MEELLSKYIEAFRKMKRAALRGYTAPHKPVLYLTIDYYEKRQKTCAKTI